MKRKTRMGVICLICGNEIKRRFRSAKHSCDCPEILERAAHIFGSRSAIKDEVARLAREVEKRHAATLKSGKPRGRRQKKLAKPGLVLSLAREMFHDEKTGLLPS